MSDEGYKDDLPVPPTVAIAEAFRQVGPPEPVRRPNVKPGAYREHKRKYDELKRERDHRREQLRTIQCYRPEGLRFPVDGERLERGVEAWLLGAGTTKVAQLLGVATGDFEIWQQTRGWEALLDIFRDPVRINVHARLTRIVSLTLAKIEERLDLGDPIVGSDGRTIGYRPIRLKDLDSLAATMVDKQVVVEKRLNGEADHTTALLPANVEELALRLRSMALEEKVVGEVKGDYHGPES